MVGRAVALGAGILGVLAQACGGGSSGPTCWPIEGTTQGGTVELGTGLAFYEPMGASIQFIVGNQGGTFLVMHARMAGLEPGNPTDPTDRANPHTMFTVELADGQKVAGECPISLAYTDTGGGSFTLARSYFMPFLPFSLGENAFDTDVTISVEVVDAQLRTARAERVVRALSPPEYGGPMFDAQQVPEPDATAASDAAGPDGAPDAP